MNYSSSKAHEQSASFQYVPEEEDQSKSCSTGTEKPLISIMHQQAIGTIMQNHPTAENQMALVRGVVVLLLLEVVVGDKDVIEEGNCNSQQNCQYILNEFNVEHEES